MTGAYLTVTKGRTASSVLMVGPDAQVDPDDLAVVLDTLRARLARSG